MTGGGDPSPDRPSDRPEGRPSDRPEGRPQDRPEARRGTWLGIDVGAVRIGVARSDPFQIMAFPVRTVAFDPSERRADLAEIQALVTEHEAVGVVVGLPRTLAGREGPAAAAARSFGDALAARIEPVPLRYVDERMTTVLAQRNLTTSGVRGRARRAVVDQAAAVEILRSFLASSAR